MEMNVEELKDLQYGVRRMLDREIEHLQERHQQLVCFQHSIEVNDELVSEIDALNEKLERKEQEIESLSDDNERLQREIDELRLKLVEQKEQQLAEAPSKEPCLTEIHNHFEPGSSAQVFNDKVNGRFSKTQKKKWQKKKNKRAAKRA